MTLIARIRKRLGIKPPFEKARQRINDAIKAGEISDNDLLKEVGPRIDKILGGDRWFEGEDWIELEMQAEELHLALISVRDLMYMFETIDKSYEP